ncbi:LysM peptidoglycan-binding domain-containing protein [Peptoniphilus sp.]|jgi:nucleoid-associated protein YgaU|uniref:LysM peptidoglycan-binding domain-containing protein n=1 Tax=Peptoniphilus sp. TaxID=1971214 RepID=UPI003D928032
MKKRYYLKKSKILMFLLFIFIFNTGLVIQKEDFAKENNNFVIYTVKQGDNLWNIVDKYNDGNKMKLILEVERINKTTSENLKPGDKLVVPVVSR